MPKKPATSLEDLIGRRFDALGLQFAHIIGVKFYDEDQLDWLESLLGVGEDTNFIVLPETERGSAIFGVAAHLGFQNGAFDRFFFDEKGRDSLKFLDQTEFRRGADIGELTEKQQISSPELDAINARYREDKSRTLDRKAGKMSVSNHRFFFNQKPLRGLGWGRGRICGQYSRQLATVSVRVRF